MLTEKCSFSTSTEISELTVDWNGPTTRPFVRFDSRFLALPIAELFEGVVGRFPTKSALDDGQSQLTYGELWSLTRALASRIVRETGPRELVGILLPTSTSFEIAMLACFIAGRPFAPLDLHYPKQWIANVVEQAKMKAVIGRFDDQATCALTSPFAKRIDIGTTLITGSGSVNNAWCAPALGPDAPAIVLFTSGSTGRPKGIVNSQRNLLRRVEQHINAGHIGEDDRFLPLSSGCTIAGVRERLTALLSGATLHCIDVQRAGVRQILQTICRSGITIMYGLPALLRALSQSDSERPPAALRLVRVGGEAVLWSDVARLRSWLPPNCLIQVGYSSSESPIMQWFIPRDFPREGSSAPIGYPLAGSEISILDEVAAAVMPGEVGELIVRSPYVALGHWIDGECVPDAFPARSDNPPIRLFRSGDLVRLRPDGLIDIVGRKDRQLKIQGQRVEPAELEAAVLNSEHVADAAALPRNVAKSIKIIAYVVLRPNRPESVLTELASLLQTTLPSQLQPHRIFAIAAIPRLAGGKLDLQALRKIDRKRQRDEAQVRNVSQNAISSGCNLTEGPVNATEDTIAAIWSRLLEKPTVGRHQEFLGLGGDSLKILQVMFEIEKTLGVQLPITMIHQCPTIALLAKAVDQQVQPVFSPLVLVKEGSGAAPFFIVHGCGGTVMELFPLARAINWSGCIYAIQAQGLDGQRLANGSITEMADLYRAAIRKVQPSGPYFLSGYSYGGLVAFEMARRLQNDGETVAFLGLLDTSANPRQWPLHVWVRQMLLRIRHHSSKLMEMPRLGKMPYLREILRSFRVHVRWRLGRGQENSPRYHTPDLPPVLRRVRESMIEAAANYRPGYYAGVATLYCSSGLPAMKYDPYAVWKDHVNCLDMVTVTGNHRTMMMGEDRVNLAQHLSHGLAKAELGKQTQNSGGAAPTVLTYKETPLGPVSAGLEF